jgi:hypothetical protein
MKKILVSTIVSLAVLLNLPSCNNAQQLHTLEQLSLLQQEDIKPYLVISNNFEVDAKEAMEQIQRSPKVQKMLTDPQNTLLIEKFPTLAAPFFVINIRQS